MLDPNMNILVVDDFNTMRRIIKTALKQIGFKTILEADDGTTALRVLKEHKIDLILADWNMPKMSGIQLLKEVREDESLKEIPFVLVTAEAQKDNVIQAIKAGVNNYLVKPFTADGIKEKLEQVFPG